MLLVLFVERARYAFVGRLSCLRRCPVLFPVPTEWVLSLSCLILALLA